MPRAAAGCRSRVPNAMPMAPLTKKMSQIAAMPFITSTAAGQVSAWPWNDATTTLLAAPMPNNTRVMMNIQAANTTTRPAQTVSRPGPCVNVVLRVLQPNSEPVKRAPTTIAIAAPTGNAAPMTKLTSWSGYSVRMFATLSVDPGCRARYQLTE